MVWTPWQRLEPQDPPSRLLHPQTMSLGSAEIQSLLEKFGGRDGEKYPCSSSPPLPSMSRRVNLDRDLCLRRPSGQGRHIRTRPWRKA